MIHLISYANHRYKKSSIIFKKEAQDFGVFDSITIYGPECLDKKFYSKNKFLLKKSRGGGYWLWKPYIIKKKLEEINEGDYLIYLDCGCTINKDGIDRFNQYLDMLNNSEYGIISFQFQKEGWRPEKYWTISQIFNYFKIKDDNILNSGQIIGGILILQKKQHSKKIINLWYDIINVDYRFFSDSYNKKNQKKYFIENRHDQSVLTVIRKIHGSIVLSDETQFLDTDKSFLKDSTKRKKYPFWATRRIIK